MYTLGYLITITGTGLCPYIRLNLNFFVKARWCIYVFNIKHLFYYIVENAAQFIMWRLLSRFYKSI